MNRCDVPVVTPRALASASSRNGVPVVRTSSAASFVPLAILDNNPPAPRFVAPAAFLAALKGNTAAASTARDGDSRSARSATAPTALPMRPVRPPARASVAKVLAAAGPTGIRSESVAKAFAGRC